MEVDKTYKINLNMERQCNFVSGKGVTDKIDSDLNPNLVAVERCYEWSCAACDQSIDKSIGQSWCGYGRSFIQMEDDNSYSKTIAFNRDIY